MSKSGKRKRAGGKKKYYLLKVPKFITQAWWDDSKYPAQSVVGQMEIGAARAKKKQKTGRCKTDWKLVVNTKDPWDPSKSRYNAVEGGVVEANLVIPRQLSITETKLFTKPRFKHMKYSTPEEQKLVVFSEKTLPALNKSLEVVTQNRTTVKAIILNIYEQRGVKMCEVQYEEDGDKEKDVELGRVKWAKKCKLVSYIDKNMEANPIMNPEYRHFLKNRFQKDSARTSVNIGRNASIFDIKDKKRRRELVERKLEISRKKQRMINEGPKLKRVRRDVDVYRKSIFKAFDSKAYLTREELRGWCGDATGPAPWPFIKETVGQLCVYHNVGDNTGTFSLKDDYKLATDAETI